MKTKFLILSVLISMISCKNQKKVLNGNENGNEVAASHTSENSLDWTGVYRGILPCADCEGIEVRIRLNKDLTYTMSRKYKGEDVGIFRGSGSFKWNDAGNKVIFDNEQAAQYKVVENGLIQLDANGNKIEGELASMFSFKKIDFDQEITGKYWKLIKLNGEAFDFKESRGKEPHFILKTAENKVTGSSGCNTFFGTYELLEYKKIQFEKMASTMMACPTVDYENEVLHLFEEVDHYSLKGETLKFLNADKDLIASFEVVYLY